MIYYVFVPIMDITPELEAMQCESVLVKQTVYYTFTDGVYGVLMFDVVPEGYVGMDEVEARDYINSHNEPID